MRDDKVQIGSPKRVGPDKGAEGVILEGLIEDIRDSVHSKTKQALRCVPFLAQKQELVLTGFQLGRSRAKLGIVYRIRRELSSEVRDGACPVHISRSS